MFRPISGLIMWKIIKQTVVVSPPAKCDFHQDRIIPKDTQMGKNENRRTSEKSLKFAGSGANN